MSRETAARWLLVPLLVAVLLAAIASPWRAQFCMDNRTYFEMVRGVVAHGLPVIDNGPVDRFPELQVRWSQRSHGRLWGSYPPVYPYLAAPFYALGGSRLVIRANIALLAVLALGVASLTRRLSRDPMLGTVAAYVLLLGTHVWTFTFDISPYTVLVTCIAWSAFFAVRAADDDGVHPRRDPFVAGFLGALGGCSHPLGLPMALGLAGMLLFAPHERERSLGARHAWWSPSRGSLARCAWAMLGVLTVALPVALHEHVRFGDWNPIGTGRCVWRSCGDTGLAQQGILSLFVYGAPVFAWGALTVVAMRIVRGSRVGRVLVASSALVALAVPGSLHDVTLATARLTWAFVVDLGSFDLGLWHPDDRYGNFLGPFAIKSLLQCVPALVLAALVPAATPRDRRLLALLLVPCAATLVPLVLRGNIALLYALGFPYLDLRYVTPLLPVLVPLATIGAARLGWKSSHILVTAALALALLEMTGTWANDVSVWRRAYTLRAPVVLAALLLVSAVRAMQPGASRAWRRVALALAVMAFAHGGAVMVGIDLRRWITDRNGHELTPTLVREHTPKRFAIIGLLGGGAIDSAASLRSERDIEYADVGEIGNFAEFGPLYDHWRNEHRPVYGLLWPGFTSPWPDVRAELVEPRVWLYRFVPAH